MNCSSCSEVADSARWLSQVNIQRVTVQREDASDEQTHEARQPHILSNPIRLGDHFFLSPMEEKIHKTQRLTMWGFRSEVFLRVPLYTWVSSVGRSFLLIVLWYSAFQLLCLWGFLDLGWLRWLWKCCLFFFFFEKSEQSIMIVLSSMADTIPVWYNPQHKTDADCFRKPWKLWFYTLAHPMLLHKREWSSKKIFFVPGPITKPLFSRS